MEGQGPRSRAGFPGFHLQKPSGAPSRLIAEQNQSAISLPCFIYEK
jgi:hypothetical protein